MKNEIDNYWKKFRIFSYFFRFSIIALFMCYPYVKQANVLVRLSSFPCERKKDISSPPLSNQWTSMNFLQDSVKLWIQWKYAKNSAGQELSRIRTSTPDKDLVLKDLRTNIWKDFVVRNILFDTNRKKMKIKEKKRREKWKFIRK